MKRILYVSTSTTAGGAEKTLYTLATLVDPKVCRVAGVVSIKKKGFYARKLEAAGTPVYSLDVERTVGLSDLQKLAVVIHETKPDLVHAIMYQAIQLCRGVRRLGYAEFKLISSPRVNYRTREGLSLWIDSILRTADDMLVSECEASRSYLIDKQGYDKAKTMTIRNGVDIAGWPISKTGREKRRKEMQLGKKDVLIGAIGRLDVQKGHIFLLEAVAKLRVSHPVKCVLIGTGPLEGELIEAARRLRIEDHVMLAGEQDDIPVWLSAIDIFVMPSLWEGLPNALLEAMALGLPVVASRVDGIPEAIAHDISGILCPPKDSQALFTPLQDLIVDAALRKTLGEGAKTVVNEHFKLVDMLQKYETLYKDILEQDP